MVTRTFEGVIETFQGETLNPPISYKGSVSVPETKAEAIEKTLWPGDDVILGNIQDKLETAEKAKRYQQETKQLREDYEKSPKFLKKNLYDSLLKSGFSVSDAEGIVAMKFGA